jgi:tRNA A37 threonylcarbamoyladenosine modification protein TsaB
VNVKSHTDTGGSTSLWLDTSALETSIALVRGDQILIQRISETNALDFLFSALGNCLKSKGLAFEELDDIYYCEGPGSSLGLRIGAMALKTWKTLRPEMPLYACRSLPFHAILLAGDVETPDSFSLVGQWKKGTWFHLEHQKNATTAAEEMNTLTDAEVLELKGPVYHIKQRKFSTQPAAHFLPVSTNLNGLPKALITPGLFRKVDQPEFFNIGTPTFKKWTPGRHR